MQTVGQFLSNPQRYLHSVENIAFPNVTNPLQPKGPPQAASGTPQWNPANAAEFAENQPNASFFAPANGIVHV